jgi:hypothetical protein
VGRTDDWGRIMTADLPLELGRDNADSIGWICRIGEADSLQLTDVTAPGNRTTLLMAVRNPGAHTLYATGADIDSRPAKRHLSAVSSTALPPGKTTSVALTVQARNCQVRSVLTGKLPPAEPYRMRRGDFDIALAITADGGPRLGTSVQLSPTQRRTVEQALARPCTGAPKVYFTVSDAHPVRRENPAVRFTLSASSPGAFVNLWPNGVLGSAPLDQSTTVTKGNWSGSGSVRADPESAIAKASRTTMRWNVRNCSEALRARSPTYRAAVRTGSRIYPYLIPINTRSVLRALADACGKRIPHNAAKHGWDT